MAKKGRQKFSQQNVDNFFGGPRTETTFVKWSTSRKRLRTADLKPLEQYMYMYVKAYDNVFWLSLLNDIEPYSILNVRSMTAVEVSIIQYNMFNQVADDRPVVDQPTEMTYNYLWFSLKYLDSDGLNSNPVLSCSVWT